MERDFIQGTHNKYEHNYTERTDDKLQEQLAVLAKSREFARGNVRRTQIEREMGMIAFELSERLREQREQEVEEAWSEYGTLEA